jgi:alpha-galactosidase
MTKISFLGAGSTVFAKNLMGDILSYPELQDATISLFDIDPARLRTSEIVAHKIADFFGISPKIEATQDRRQSLAGADFAISMFQVGGYKPGTVTDFEIPKKYGLRQTIADTLGIGGIMRGLRTIPVFARHCPRHGGTLPRRDLPPVRQPDGDELLGAQPRHQHQDRRSLPQRAGHGRATGRGHRRADRGDQLPCAGINHMAFYLKFERNGENLYPQIRRVAEEGRVPDWNRVRYEIFNRVGYFVTESSEHFSEYVPWFIKRDRPDLIEQFNIPLDEYIRRCEVQITGWEFMRRKLEKPAAD